MPSPGVSGTLYPRAEEQPGWGPGISLPLPGASPIPCLTSAQPLCCSVLPHPLIILTWAGAGEDMLPWEHRAFGRHHGTARAAALAHPVPRNKACWTPRSKHPLADADTKHRKPSPRGNENSILLAAVRALLIPPTEKPTAPGSGRGQGSE